MNLNIHFHILALDGAYTFGEETRFHGMSSPTSSEMTEVLQKIIHRTVKHLEKTGLIVKDQDVTYLKLDEHDSGFDKLQAASTIYRVAFGPRAGEKDIGALAKESGFSLHARVFCKKGERKKLEHLCRYIARPPVAEERLLLNNQGQVVYRLKKAYDDGTTHIVFSPLEFVERLASLVPRPRVNLSRYHGLFAPHAKHRKLITPKPPTTQVLAAPV